MKILARASTAKTKKPWQAIRTTQPVLEVLCRCGHERFWHQATINVCQHTRLAPPVLTLDGHQPDELFWNGQPRLRDLLPMERDCDCQTFEPDDSASVTNGEGEER